MSNRVGLWIKFKGGEGMNYSIDENFDHYVGEDREYFSWTTEHEGVERYHELCLNMDEVQAYQFNYMKDAEEIGHFGEREGVTRNLWKRKTETRFPGGEEPMCCQDMRFGFTKGKPRSADD